MNIYIYNCSNTYNYGSMMMGENLIKYFNILDNQEHNYFVETLENKNIERLVEATNYKSIKKTGIDSLFNDNLNKYSLVLGYCNIKNICSKLIDDIDMVVVLGGDDFTEDYGWKAPILNAIKFNILKRKGIKVVMLGQTMGPYHSFRRYIMKNLLGKLNKIYPRDPITYNYLKTLGLENISITDDLALMPLTRQMSLEKTKEYITYFPSELIYRYSKEGTRKDWVAFNLFMIHTVMERYPDRKLVLIAHVLQPEHVDDRKIVNELCGLIKDKYHDRIIIENNEIYPYEVRNYIQQSLFTISSRMHPVVSSIQCEIPSIAISYSSKYWGIIGERYGLEDYIIDVRHLGYTQMEEKFISLISKIESEYIEIQNKMQNENKKANKNITRTLQEIIELVD